MWEKCYLYRLQKQNTVMPETNGDKQNGDLHYLMQDLLRLPLPGAAAQMLLAPSARVRDIYQKEKELQPVRSGVLLMLYYRHSTLHISFIRRPEYPGIHSGQMAFPGGRYEPEDADLEATALRETEEETGVPREKIRVVGPLTPLYIPPSNYLVSPYLAITDNDPVFSPDPTEVAAMVEVPVELLLQPGTIHNMPPAEAFSFMEVPAFVCNGAVIWGATAMITAEFVELIRRYGAEKIIKSYEISSMS